MPVVARGANRRFGDRKPRRMSHDGGEPIRTPNGLDFGPLLRRIWRRRARRVRMDLTRRGAEIAWSAPCSSSTAELYIVLSLKHGSQQPARFCYPLDDVGPGQLAWFAAWDNWTVYLSSDDPEERAVCESAASFILNSPLLMPDDPCVVLESRLTLV